MLEAVANVAGFAGQAYRVAIAVITPDKPPEGAKEEAHSYK